MLSSGCKKTAPLSSISSPAVVVAPYTDTSESNGASKIDSFYHNDSAATVKFTLRKGFKYPYAGIIFTARDSFIDLSSYDTIQITLYSTKEQRLRAYIKTQGTPFDTTFQKERYRRFFFDIQKGENHVAIPMAELIEPNWWLRETKTTLQGLPEETYEKVVSFGVSTTTIHKNNTPYDLKLKEFTFVPSDEKNKLMTIQLALIYGVGFLLFFFIYKKTHKTTNNHPRRTGHLPITHDELFLIENTIKENLSQESLSSLDIAQLTGLDIKSVIATIKDHYGVSVKHHINTLRVARAKELLKDKTITFNEVSIACGYSDSNHFTQLFITITGQSPVSFRDSL